MHVLHPLSPHPPSRPPPTAHEWLRQRSVDAGAARLRAPALPPEPPSGPASPGRRRPRRRCRGVALTLQPHPLPLLQAAATPSYYMYRFRVIRKALATEFVDHNGGTPVRAALGAGLAMAPACHARLRSCPRPPPPAPTPAAPAPPPAPPCAVMLQGMVQVIRSGDVIGLPAGIKVGTFHTGAILMPNTTAMTLETPVNLLTTIVMEMGPTGQDTLIITGSFYAVRSHGRTARSGAAPRPARPAVPCPALRPALHPALRACVGLAASQRRTGTAAACPVAPPPPLPPPYHKRSSSARLGSRWMMTWLSLAAQMPSWGPSAITSSTAPRSRPSPCGCLACHASEGPGGPQRRAGAHSACDTHARPFPTHQPTISIVSSPYLPALYCPLGSARPGWLAMRRTYPGPSARCPCERPLLHLDTTLNAAMSNSSWQPGRPCIRTAQACTCSLACLRRRSVAAPAGMHAPGSAAQRHPSSALRTRMPHQSGRAQAACAHSAGHMLRMSRALPVRDSCLSGALRWCSRPLAITSATAIGCTPRPARYQPTAAQPPTAPHAPAARL